VEIDFMKERLDRLLREDTQVRWRILCISGLVIFAWGLIGQIFTDATLLDLQIGATLAGVVAFGTQLMVYGLGLSFYRSRIGIPAFPLLRSSGAIAGAAGFAILAQVFLPRLEAAVATRRLKTALSLSDPQAKVAAVSRIFKSAERSQIELSELPLERALKETKQEKTDIAWKAHVAFLEYVVNARTDEPRRPSAATTWLDAQPSAIENICGPDNYTYGADAQLRSRHGEWISSSDRVRWPDTIHDCRLVLDGTTLTNVYIWAVLVSYSGGPLHLHNVRFGQARFDLPDENNANVRKFVDALLSADRNVVSIDLP
jgi:hypothetical protein